MTAPPQTCGSDYHTDRALAPDHAEVIDRPSPNPRTVWRFALPITDRHVLSMPGSPAILHVAPSRLAPNELDLWAVVEPGAPRQDHEILVVGTGNPLPADAGRHVGSCTTHGGDAVWHVFEVLR